MEDFPDGVCQLSFILPSAIVNSRFRRGMASILEAERTKIEMLERNQDYFDVLQTIGRGTVQFVEV